MDITQREGFYPPPAGSSSILGVEFSGEVSEVGANVSEWKLQDEVLGLAGGVSSSHIHVGRIVCKLTYLIGRLRGIYRCSGYAYTAQTKGYELG